MDPNSFKDTMPGKLIRAPEGHWSFIPNPLPPDLSLTAEIARQLELAEYALGQLSATSRLLPNPGLLTAPFVRREAVLSSRIEGTTTSLAQLYLFEADQTDEIEVQDAQEVQNYVRALQHGRDLLETLPICLRLIREVHRVLLDGTRGQERNPGEIRRVPVAIARAGQSLAEARFVPPPVSELRDALDALERYVNLPPVYPTLVDIALIHYQFEAIHPFMDGNGRVGRLLIALLLEERGKLSSPLLYLSEYFEKHREAYIDHLLRVSQEGSWLDWIAFVLHGIQTQALDGVQRSLRLFELREKWRNDLQAARVRGVALQLVDLLFARPIFEISETADSLGVTYQGANNAIQRLVEFGILEEITGHRRNRAFAAHELIRAIEEPMDEAESR